MASNSPSMKVNVTADTSEFQKGMKVSKQALRDFDKTSENALGNLGNLFGVNTGKVQQMTSAIKGMGAKLSTSANAGVASMGKLVASAGAATTAFAAIGIGAAVAAFKTLNDEANNFKQTVAGANIELQTTAYIDTYSQVMHDFNSGTGKKVAETEAKVKKGVKSTLATAKAGVVNFIGNLVEGQNVADAITNSVVETGVAAATAAGKAKEAEAIAGRIYKIQRQQSDNTVKIAKYDAQIAEQREIASDKTKSLEERTAATAKVEDLITKKYNLQVPLQQQLATAMEQMNDLAASTPAQIDAANAARVSAINLEKQKSDELRTAHRLQSSITSEVEAEANATQRAFEARKKADMKFDLSLSDSAASLSGLHTSSEGIKVPVSVEVSKADVIEQMQALTDLVNDLVKSSFEAIGDSIGGLVGDLLTGGDAWSNFADSALSAFGDMATTVGKMAIATGTAALGIETALKTPAQGWAAIAAGVALVALGSAVKSGLSNVASGNYNASTSVSSGSYSNSSTTASYETSAMTIEVTGKLYGQGSQLVAVINNENKRKEHTT